MACSAKESLALLRIGNVIAANINASVIRVLSATSAALKLPAARFVVTVWATSNWLRRFPISGTKGIPSRMGLILDISPRSLEKVLYFASFIVLDPGEGTDLVKGQLLTEPEYMEKRDKYPEAGIRGMGAQAIKELLEAIDLEALTEQLRHEMKELSGQRRVRAIRRLEVAEAFLKSGNRPEWMIMDVVPVIPPELRSLWYSGWRSFRGTEHWFDRIARVINDNRLKRLLVHAPDIIVRNEKRMLQEAVDALIDNGRRGVDSAATVL